MNIDKLNTKPLTDEEVKKEIPSLFKSRIFQAGFYKFVKKISPSMSKDEFKDVVEQFKSVESVEDVQWAAYRIAKKNIKDTIKHYEVKGIEKLNPENKYVFLSTHSNILGDPYYFGYSIMSSGFKPTRLGIGLNLTPMKILKTIMKGQGCFLIPRSNENKKLFLENTKKISELVHNIYFEDNKSIWLPNRNGRAKDNNHTTNKAIIKMLLYSFKERRMNLNDMINLYNITPVIISYEYNSSVINFAYEAEKKTLGKFQKLIQDAVTSYKGLADNKGNVKIIFGEPIKGEYASIKDVAKSIDEFIIPNYPLWNINRIAYGIKNNSDYSVMNENEHQFLKQLNRMKNENIKNYIINYYAKPVEKKLEKIH